MIRRCILEVSSNQSFGRLPRHITAQMPAFLSSRKEFSVAPKNNTTQKTAPPEKPSGTGSQISKYALGGVAVGAAVIAAYQTGYIGQHYVKEEQSPLESSEFGTGNKNLEEVELMKDYAVSPSNEEPSRSSPNAGDATDRSKALYDFPLIKEGEIKPQGVSEMSPAEDAVPVKEEELSTAPQGSTTINNHSSHPEASLKDGLDMGKSEDGTVHLKPSMEPNEGVDSRPTSEETVAKVDSFDHVISNNMPDDTPGNETEGQRSLLEEYLLTERDEESSEISKSGEVSPFSAPFSNEKEALGVMGEDLKDAKVSTDGKLVLDFIEAIHAAERKQAELDNRIYSEEKRLLKERYEKELKDARARQLMYAEETALLEKELNKERAKAESTIKSLQEKAEGNLKMELQHKEEEAKMQLKKAQELAKAELAAAIANEKSSQIEKMAEANLHINALCMAFYARSEEARQSHSVHKLALGALALEDALSKGLPIQQEIDALYTSLEGIDRDSLLDLAFSSLPRETLNNGTDTQLQLNQKFNALKGMLRHFSLIPAGGGGLLTHAVAHIASSLKMSEDDQSGDGIESVISRVESFLAEGKLAEAADSLEGGVCGTRAEGIISDWVRQARNRAITEQALSLLQSYATSISLTT
ncbi:MICOS complex subunit MIC60, mitochondrial isoform X2 [Magnolia sinica]|uniref:MICOS complex subunit MIC60, mitochondrial isoform X2 n=1 Tax=Magnolia sinica TaxID=86752 RepID=UPI00265AE0B4|nr:MICOS complex subunit MIC60, mitochondrial isoform X2 [Magnolia sinica]